MSTRYTTYTARVGRDSTLPVRYEEAVGGGLVRVHYTLNRIPSRREFVIWNRRDATPEDRGRAQALLPGLPSWFALVERESPESIAKLKVSDSGDRVFAFQLAGGRAVDDPLIQLELEMMIECTSEVDA